MRRRVREQSTRSARRGITIIEVLIVVTGVAMLLGLCAVSIQVLMKLNGDVQARYGAAVALERLARQLRDDAHASETAQIGVEPKGRKAREPAAHIRARSRRRLSSWRDGGVVRTESRAGKVGPARVVYTAGRRRRAVRAS